MIRRSSLLVAIAVAFAAAAAGCTSGVVPVEQCIAPGDGRLTVQHLHAIGRDYPAGVPPLGRIHGLTVGDDGTVFVLGTSRLFAFDANGGYLWHIREGHAPGEVNRARGVVAVGNQIFLSNNGGRRLDRLSYDGQFEVSVPVDQLGFDRLSLRGVVRDSLLVASAQTHTSHVATVILLSAKTLSTTGAFVVSRSPLATLPASIVVIPPVSTFGDDIVVGHSDRYLFSVHSLVGDTLDVIQRDIPEYAPIGTAVVGGNPSARVFSGLGRPIAIAGGYRLVDGYWPNRVIDPDAVVRAAILGRGEEVETRRAVDVYDSNWCLVASMYDPNFDGFAAQSLEWGYGDGRVLVSVLDEESVLREFRIEIVPNRVVSQFPDTP